MSDVVVIGAGPAGLMTALGVAQRGHSCTVLEALPVVGGMAGSFAVAGQRVDYGSHRLHPATSPTRLKLLKSLLGSDLQVRPRNGRIRLQGRWINFPLRAVDMVRNLPPRFALRAMTDVASGPVRRRVHNASDSFESEVTRRLGAAVAREFYVPYARKLYGVEASELDRELARRRVFASGAGTILRRIVRASRPQGRTFLYPRLGYGQISEALAAAATGAGADLRLNSAVNSVKVTGKGVEVRAAHIVRADLVFSTMPLPALASVLSQRALPPSIKSALKRCRNRAMVLAYLVVNRPKFTSFDAHYFPGGETVVSRLSEPKNYRDGEDPRNHTVLCAEIPCWRNDSLWQSSDQRISRLVVDGIRACGLPLVDPSSVTVRRLPSVYPVYEIATANDRANLDRWIRELAPQGVVVLGRQGLGVPDNLHHVLAMAEAAASSTGDDGTFDHFGWAQSLDGFASHVVED